METLKIGFIVKGDYEKNIIEKIVTETLNLQNVNDIEINIIRIGSLATLPWINNLICELIDNNYSFIIIILNTPISKIKKHLSKCHVDNNKILIYSFESLLDFENIEFLNKFKEFILKSIKVS